MSRLGLALQTFLMAFFCVRETCLQCVPVGFAEETEDRVTLLMGLILLSLILYSRSLKKQASEFSLH